MRQGGTWDPLLQCLYGDTPLLQTAKKRYGTKNDCMHAQLRQMLNERYKEVGKPNCYFCRAFNKISGSGTKAEYCTCPPQTPPTKGWGKSPLWPKHWTQPYSLHIRNKSSPPPPHPPSPQEVSLFLLSPCCSRSPN